MNKIAQDLIKAMKKPPHLTHEDVEGLRQSIKDGKIPINYDSPFHDDAYIAARKEACDLVHEGEQRAEYERFMNAIEHLETFGYCIVPPQHDEKRLDILHARYTAMMDAHKSEFLFGVLNHSQWSWDLATNSDVLQIARHCLGHDIRIGAVACKLLKSESKIQGVQNGQLRIHSDGTEPFHRTIPNIPFMINTMFCLTDFTKEGGAFGVIPFSHKSPLLKPDVLNLYNHTEIENETMNTVPVECPRGSWILWDARLWHGHFPNTTDTPRLNLNISYYPKWWNIRIEHNHQPVPPSLWQQMPQELQAMVKYKVGTRRSEVYEIE